MKNTIIKTLFIFILFVPQFVLSAVAPTVRVMGKIDSYDRKTVTLIQSDKNGERKVKVPKESISENFKIKSGQCVYATLNFEDMMSSLQSDVSEEEVKKSNNKKKKSSKKKKKVKKLSKKKDK